MRLVVAFELLRNAAHVLLSEVCRGGVRRRVELCYLCSGAGRLVLLCETRCQSQKLRRQSSEVFWKVVCRKQNYLWYLHGV